MLEERAQALRKGRVIETGGELRSEDGIGLELGSPSDTGTRLGVLLAET